jgi:hypothetical protein
MLTGEQASAELNELMHGKTRWHYAFAFGAGCTLSERGDEVYAAIRAKDAQLRAIIAEHKATT